jgi:PEP-CTERM motif
MNKRSLVLCMAAGLLASLAFAAPSHAGMTLVTTDVTFSVTGANSPTITDFRIQYSPVPMPGMTAPTISGSMDGGIGATVGSFSAATSIVEISFAASANTTSTIEFTFYTTASPGSVGGNFLDISGLVNGPVASQDFHVAVMASAVPEPASLALLGIGMTGFLAFRRFFKKTAVA